MHPVSAIKCMSNVIDATKFRRNVCFFGHVILVAVRLFDGHCSLLNRVPGEKKPTYIHTYMYLLNTDKSRPIKSHGQRSVFQLALRSLDQFAYFGCLILRKIAQVTGDTGNYFNLAAKWLSSTLNPVWRLLTSLGYIFYYCIYVCTFSFEPLVAGDKSQVFSDF